MAIARVSLDDVGAAAAPDPEELEVDAQAESNSAETVAAKRRIVRMIEWQSRKYVGKYQLTERCYI